MSSEPTPLDADRRDDVGIRDGLAGRQREGEGGIAGAGRLQLLVKHEIAGDGVAVGFNICSDVRKNAVAPGAAPAAGRMRTSSGSVLYAMAPMVKPLE